MKHVRFASALFASVALPAAAATISNFNVTYSENFDTLALSGTSSTTPAGWTFSESGSSANSTYTAGTGTSNTGDTYSFGATNSTDRAFGSIQSGTLASTLGTFITNSTGSTLTQLTISFTGEQWRLGATNREDRLDFSFSTDATSLTTGTWISNTALNFIAPVTSGAVGALDGNTAANRTAITATLSGLNITNGSSLWIRWSDFNATGFDDGLAIDDFSVSANQTTPASVPDTLHLSVPIAMMFAMFFSRRFWTVRSQYDGMSC